MAQLTLRNALTYVALWALNALMTWVALKIAAGSLLGFAAGQPFADRAQSTAATLTLIASGLGFWLAAHRPRLGREDLNNLISEIGTFDARAALREVLSGYSEPVPPLTDEETNRIADGVYTRIEARMQGKVH